MSAHVEFVVVFRWAISRCRDWYPRTRVWKTMIDGIRKDWTRLAAKFRTWCIAGTFSHNFNRHSHHGVWLCLKTDLFNDSLSSCYSTHIVREFDSRAAEWEVHVAANRRWRQAIDQQMRNSSRNPEAKWVFFLLLFSLWKSTVRWKHLLLVGIDCSICSAIDWLIDFKEQKFVFLQQISLFLLQRWYVQLRETGSVCRGEADYLQSPHVPAAIHQGGRRKWSLVIGNVARSLDHKWLLYYYFRCSSRFLTHAIHLVVLRCDSGRGDAWLLPSKKTFRRDHTDPGRGPDQIEKGQEKGTSLSSFFTLQILR